MLPPSRAVKRIRHVVFCFGRTIAVYASVVLLVVACDRKPSGSDGTQAKTAPPSWPPRTHRLDSDASAVPSSAKLTLEIDPAAPLRWSGDMETQGGRFIPVQDAFTIQGGTLISRLGAVEKRATFSAWLPIQESSESNSVIGWGPCLTEGEVLLPNIFLQEVPKEGHVGNSFEAEDFRDGYTLIRLKPDKKHRLCVWFRKPTRGMVFFGSMRSSGTAKISGACDPLAGPSAEPEDKAPVLYCTAGCIGGEVQFGAWTFARKSDGWYVGKDKVGK